MRVVLDLREVAAIIGEHLAKQGVGHGGADVTVHPDGHVEVVFDRWGPAPATTSSKPGLRLVKR